MGKLETHRLFPGDEKQSDNVRIRVLGGELHSDDHRSRVPALTIQLEFPPFDSPAEPAPKTEGSEPAPAPAPAAAPSDAKPEPTDADADSARPAAAAAE